MLTAAAKVLCCAAMGVALCLDRHTLLAQSFDFQQWIIAPAGVADGASGGVFMVGDEGKGTTRLYAGFNANKAPGAGGKVLMKVERLVGVAAMREADDIFIISRLGKIIRFAAGEVPAKEGVVQGVNCMALRADECVALTVSPG